MTRKELYRALDKRIPVAHKEDWDNDGAMLLPDAAFHVQRILCTLDVSDEVVDYAKKNSFDLILSHHPLIFAGVKALDGENPVSRRILLLLASNIAVFSFHTRLDAMKGGVNDALARMIGLEDIALIDDGEGALGRVGMLPSPMPFEDFCARVKDATGAPFVNTFKKTDTVSRVAVVGGEGKDFISLAEAAGADTYLSGRLGYHAMLDGEINLIECGHYFSERHTANLLAGLAAELLPHAEIEIYVPNSLTVY